MNHNTLIPQDLVIVTTRYLKTNIIIQEIIMKINNNKIEGIVVILFFNFLFHACICNILL